MCRTKRGQQSLQEWSNLIGAFGGALVGAVISGWIANRVAKKSNQVQYWIDERRRIREELPPIHFASDTIHAVINSTSRYIRTRKLSNEAYKREKEREMHEALGKLRTLDLGNLNGGVRVDIKKSKDLVSSLTRFKYDQELLNGLVETLELKAGRIDYVLMELNLKLDEINMNLEWMEKSLSKRIWIRGKVVIHSIKSFIQRRSINIKRTWQKFKRQKNTQEGSVQKQEYIKSE